MALSDVVSNKPGSTRGPSKLENASKALLTDVQDFMPLARLFIERKKTPVTEGVKISGPTGQDITSGARSSVPFR